MIGGFRKQLYVVYSIQAETV